MQYKQGDKIYDKTMTMQKTLLKGDEIRPAACYRCRPVT